MKPASEIELKNRERVSVLQTYHLWIVRIVDAMSKKKKDVHSTFEALDDEGKRRFIQEVCEENRLETIGQLKQRMKKVGAASKESVYLADISKSLEQLEE